MKISKILVPLDFSEFGKEALALAESWAKSFGASLHLLHVIDLRDLYSLDPQSMETSIVLENTLRQRAQKKLESYSKNLKVPCETEIRLGSPLEEIEDCIQEKKINLVVISTHGRTGLKHVLLGSVAEKVVHHSSCPVLTFKPSSLKN